MPPTKTKIAALLFVGLVVAIAVFGLWRTPITAYQPQSDAEQALTDLFIQYITARNNRDVDRFLATLHRDCRYHIDKDHVVGKDELRGMLPGLWMQNDRNTVAFGQCMAWECWNENFYRTGMLVNPKFRIAGDQAEVRFKFVAGIFMDDNCFHLVRENGTWRIVRFARPIY